MTWLDFCVFALLALLCNTAFPLPFDPVLIYFASRSTSTVGVALAICGSICAGVAGAAEGKVLAILRRRFQGAEAVRSSQSREDAFYVMTFLFALLPLPFSVVRLTALTRQPRPALYALTIILGRLPRYVLTVIFWRVLALPQWANVVIIMAAMAFSACKSMLRCRPDAVGALEDRRTGFSCCTRAAAGGARQILRFGLRKRSGAA